jgi:translation elongation factor EF-1alpha
MYDKAMLSVCRYEKEAREMGKASFFLAWLMDEDR